MTNDQEYYKEKFLTTQTILETESIQNIVSLKYREVTNDSEYLDFFNELDTYSERIKIQNIHSNLHGNLHGRGWLSTDNYRNKALLVEHESGLEVLYIASSIASLLSFLIPTINSAWKAAKLRRFRDQFFNNNADGVEIRFFDKDNNLVEQKFFRVEDYLFSELIKENTNMTQRVNQLEIELLELKTKNAKKKLVKTIKHQ